MLLASNARRGLTFQDPSELREWSLRFGLLWFIHCIITKTHKKVWYFRSKVLFRPSALRPEKNGSFSQSWDTLKGDISLFCTFQNRPLDHITFFPSEESGFFEVTPGSRKRREDKLNASIPSGAKWRLSYITIYRHTKGKKAAAATTIPPFTTI